MVLLTGATGFLGSWLLAALVKSKYQVVCIKRPKSNCHRVSEFAEKVRWFDSDGKNLENLFLKYKVEVIIHCAVKYGRSDEEYFEAYESNLVFPLHLLAYAEKYGCRYFINTGTFFARELLFVKNIQDAVYMDTYVCSKDMFCRIAKKHIKKMNLTFINLQLEHIYGRNDNSGKFVEWLVENLRRNAPVVKLTNGKQKRDWTYIEDVVSAYMIVLNCLPQFELAHYYHLEVGTGTATSLMEFARAAKEILRSTTKLEFGGYNENTNELKISCADNAALCELGWQPQYDIYQGIAQMVKE